MSTRRIEGLRARAERGSTEGERRAARIASGAVVISWAAGASAAAVAVLNSVLALVMVGTLTSLTVIALGQAKK